MSKRTFALERISELAAKASKLVEDGNERDALIELNWLAEYAQQLQLPSLTERHNGWTNRETWAVALWIDNDEAWQKATCDLARTMTTVQLADAIKEDLEQLAHNLLEQPDLVTHAARLMLHDVGSMWRVNWLELAQHYSETV